MTDQHRPATISVEAAGQLLGISRSAAYRAANAGTLCPPYAWAAGCSYPPPSSTSCWASPPTSRQTATATQPGTPATKGPPATATAVDRTADHDEQHLLRHRLDPRPAAATRSATGARVRHRQLQASRDPPRRASAAPRSRVPDHHDLPHRPPRPHPTRHPQSCTRPIVADRSAWSSPASNRRERRTAGPVIVSGHVRETTTGSPDGPTLGRLGEFIDYLTVACCNPTPSVGHVAPWQPWRILRRALGPAVTYHAATSRRNGSSTSAGSMTALNVFGLQANEEVS